MADETNDELVSQFLAFTGSSDVERASSYLEMSGGDLETAVGLFMEHTSGGGGGAGDPGVAASPDVRAPDETRTMRLMDHGPMMMGGGGGMPLIGALMEAEDDDLMEGAMASAFSRAMDPRDAVNAAAAAAAAAAVAIDEEYKYEDIMDESSSPPETSITLGDLFAPPNHLIHRGGGFQGARSVAKDARRWLLVNIQKDSEFSSHALNRDVWRDELVENLIREGFIFWQTMNDTSEGRLYSERYSVRDYPHLSIIDPRTGRLMWSKEGWTQEHPLTKEDFCEMAMDFCSRHSFDKPSVARKQSFEAASQKTPKKIRSEEEELQAALRASLNDDEEEKDDDDDDEVEYLGGGMADDVSNAPEAAQPSFVQELLAWNVGEEPASGARIQIRMPDAKRLVRKFSPDDTVKSIYAFVAQSNEEAKGGKEFSLMSGFPPKDLLESLENTVESCGLDGQAITGRWK